MSFTNHNHKGLWNRLISVLTGGDVAIAKRRMDREGLQASQERQVSQELQVLQARQDRIQERKSAS